jgi:hypothetical protein
MGKNKGLTGTSMYCTWSNMRRRCRDHNHPNYKYYGGRGIEVCESWQGKNGFMNFVNDMGIRPDGLSIDRINNDGNYNPANCRWATTKQQANNKRMMVFTKKKSPCLNTKHQVHFFESEERIEIIKRRITGKLYNGKPMTLTDYYKYLSDEFLFKAGLISEPPIKPEKVQFKGDIEDMPFNVFHVRKGNL